MIIDKETKEIACCVPFALDVDPVQSARAHADWHVPLGLAAVLNTAMAVFAGNHLRLNEHFPNGHPNSHVINPHSGWARWAAASYFNFNWLLVQGLELCHEHKYRFKHLPDLEYSLLQDAVSARGKLNYPSEDRTPWPVPVEDSRKIYLMLSPAIFTASPRWTLTRPAPEWYVRETAAVLLS